MKNNERGSTLLVVLLMVLVFSILGLSILSTSIGGAKRTEFREEQVQTDLEDIRTLNEAVAYIKELIEQKYDPEMSNNQYKNLIEQITNNPYGYNIDDLSETEEYRNKININQDFTRVLHVDSGKYSQLVYITGIPSFLKYAAGSRGILTLNGSTFFEEGNIYAKEMLRVSNKAKYIFGENKVKETYLSSVSNNSQSYLFIEEEKIEKCSSNCYENGITNNENFYTVPVSQINEAFEPHAPIYTRDNTEYIGVNIERTFKEKLQVAGFIDSISDPYQYSVTDIINNASELTMPIKIINSFEEIDESDSPYINGYLFKASGTEPIYVDIDSVQLDKNKWIVIDGDAVVENSFGSSLQFSGNMLVTGDLTIRGGTSEEIPEDIYFDSTIYVLGTTTVNNVNIRGLNDGELILMSEGTLEIARINKFKNNEENIIKAYLYTSQDAVVYAMGSYLFVEGGIFARGNLEINAYRGNATANPGDIDISFESRANMESSRLRIKNNKRLFLNQVQGLPKIDKLEVMTDLMKNE